MEKSPGLQLVQGGRAARFQAARSALDAQRSDDQDFGLYRGVRHAQTGLVCSRMWRLQVD